MTISAETSLTMEILGNLELIGPIVRLQVQTSSLKHGQRPRSWYDPSPIRAVPALRLDDGGVTGVDDGDIADAHHRDHPQSKHRRENGVSVGFTGHYNEMRSRFGGHLVDGIAGENILVDAEGIFTAADVGQGFTIVGAHCPVELTSVEYAKPCVEFSKFCAGYARDQRPDIVITETLQYLNLGTRGFYATLVDESGTSTPVVALGDLVYRRFAD